VQHRARPRKESGLDMADLQACANPCNNLFITRNEQEGGSSPLVGSQSMWGFAGETGEVEKAGDPEPPAF
jgi:hypothetical protein